MLGAIVAAGFYKFIKVLEVSQARRVARKKHADFIYSTRPPIQIKMLQIKPLFDLRPTPHFETTTMRLWSQLAEHTARRNMHPDSNVQPQQHVCRLTGHVWIVLQWLRPMKHSTA